MKLNFLFWNLCNIRLQILWKEKIFPLFHTSFAFHTKENSLNKFPDFFNRTYFFINTFALLTYISEDSFLIRNFGSPKKIRKIFLIDLKSND